MKNIGAYVFITIVSLVMVVATAFLMTAADEPIRRRYVPASDLRCSGYLERLQSRSAGDGL